jgi:biopolymer transport protein ExbD
MNSTQLHSSIRRSPHADLMLFADLFANLLIVFMITMTVTVSPTEVTIAATGPVQAETTEIALTLYLDSDGAVRIGNPEGAIIEQQTQRDMIANATGEIVLVVPAEDAPWQALRALQNLIETTPERRAVFK